MDELIARLEAATEGDTGLRIIGGLDDQIWRLVNDKQWLFKGWQYDLKEAPAYTTSLDAALTLAPTGFIEMRRYSDGRYVKVTESSTNPVQHEGTQKPAALAICIAALKALRARSHTAPQ